MLGEIDTNIYHPPLPYPNAEHVVGQPSPLVYYVLHAHVDRGQYPAQLSYPAGSVAQRCVELDQSAVDGQSSVQTPAQYRRVYVAAAQQQNDPMNRNEYAM